MLKGKNEDLIMGMLYVGFFFYVTNNKEIINKVPQIMHCTYLMSYQTNDHRRSKNEIKEGSNIIF
jgi:hypothetical protein